MKIKDIVSGICLFFLLLNPALAQSTAAILPQGRTQFLDNNGNPLSSGKVYFYVPSTTTFKTTWQDAAETIANANPVVLDAGGRAIIYGNGSYRQRVFNSANTLIYDAVTASAGTGGSTPTAFGDGAAVGSIKAWSGLTPPVNYVYSFGQELSRTTYSVLFATITLTQNLSCASGSPILTGIADTSQIPIGAVLESTCISAGSTVISKTTTSVTMNTNSPLTTATTGLFFLYGNGNGTTTFNVPDLRGNVVAGRCNMGGTDCTNLTVTGLGETASATGAVGGSQIKTLTVPNFPPYSPLGSVTSVIATGSVSTPTITVNNGTNIIQGSAGSSFGGGAVGTGVTITATSSAPTFTGTGGTATFTGTAQGGTSTPFSLVQPTMTLNYVIKILPDVSLSTTSVVTSLGGMQGDITCGTWLVCGSSNISVSINPAPAATILMNPTSGSGTANLFTIQGLTNQAAPDPNNDFIPLYHAATGTIQKVTAGILSSIGVSGVSSFNGRTGAVTPASNDYTASIVNYTSIGTGAVTQTIKNRLDQVLLATDFGVVCDGITDTQAALQLALNAAGTLGRSLVLPGGTCIINSAVAANGPNSFDLIGQGTGATTIRSTFATGDVFTYNVTRGSIRHLQFNSSVVRTGGATIRLIPNGALVSDVYIDNPYIGIHNTGVGNQINNSHIGVTSMTSRAVQSAGGGIRNINGILQINNTVISGATSVAADMADYGIFNAGEIDMSTSYIFSVNNGILAQPGAGQGAIMGMTDVWIDSVLNSGITLDGTSGTGELEAMITGSWITCGYNSTTCTAAINLGPNASRIAINGNLIVAYNGGVGEGIQIGSGIAVTSVSITGNQIGLGAGLGFANGVFTGTNVGGWNVTGNTFYGNTTAMLISAGNDDYVISSNNMANNTNKITNLSAAAANSKVGLNTGVAVGVCTAAAPC